MKILLTPLNIVSAALLIISFYPVYYTKRFRDIVVRNIDILALITIITDLIFRQFIL